MQPALCDHVPKGHSTLGWGTCEAQRLKQQPGRRAGPRRRAAPTPSGRPSPPRATTPPGSRPGRSTPSDAATTGGREDGQLRGWPVRTHPSRAGARLSGDSTLMHEKWRWPRSARRSGWLDRRSWGIRMSRRSAAASAPPPVGVAANHQGLPAASVCSCGAADGAAWGSAASDSPHHTRIRIGGNIETIVLPVFRASSAVRPSYGADGIVAPHRHLEESIAWM